MKIFFNVKIFNVKKVVVKLLFLLFLKYDAVVIPLANDIDNDT